MQLSWADMIDYFWGKAISSLYRLFDFLSLPVSENETQTCKRKIAFQNKERRIFPFWQK